MWSEPSNRGPARSSSTQAFGTVLINFKRSASPSIASLETDVRLGGRGQRVVEVVGDTGNFAEQNTDADI